MEYDGAGLFHLRVTLIPSDDAETVENYESNDIDDAVVFRHPGTMKIGSRGTFDGFYALNLTK